MTHSPNKNIPTYQYTRPYKPNSPICFTHLVEKSNEFIDKFNALTEIDNINKAKLGVYQNRLYVCWNYFEGVQRTIYRDSREKLLIFLEENVSNYKHFYFKLLDMLIADNATPTLANIIQEHRKLWPKWICGINTLSLIYSDDLNFTERIKKNILDTFNLLYSSKVNF
jgi:hypothetical protein